MLIVKGILKSFDSGAYTASVQLVGSMSAFITGVPVSRALLAAEMVAGRYCAVVFYDEANFSDGVMFAVYVK